MFLAHPWASGVNATTPGTTGGPGAGAGGVLLRLAMRLQASWGVCLGPAWPSSIPLSSLPPALGRFLGQPQRPHPTPNPPRGALPTHSPLYDQAGPWLQFRTVFLIVPAPPQIENPPVPPNQTNPSPPWAIHQEIQYVPAHLVSDLLPVQASR